MRKEAAVTDNEFHSGGLVHRLVHEKSMRKEELFFKMCAGILSACVSM